MWPYCKSARSLPARTCAVPVTRLMNIMSTWPPSTSVIAGPAPLYGTCVICSPAERARLALVEGGFTARTGNWSVNAGLNWQDGGAVNSFFGGQLGVRYTFGGPAPAPAPRARHDDGVKGKC